MTIDESARRHFDDEAGEQMARQTREWCERMSRARAIQAGMERDGD